MITTEYIIEMIEAKKKAERAMCKICSRKNQKELLKQHQMKYKLYDNLIQEIKYRDKVS